MEFAWGDSKIADPVYQEEFTEAMEESGEDPGTEIDNIIIGGGHPDLSVPAALISTLGGAIAASGIIKLMEEQEEEADSRFVMYVSKHFGNELRKDDPPQYVYARIAEIPAGGGERDRPDLTEKIRPFSGDNVLDVQDAGMAEYGYHAALVKVPQDCTMSEGEVSFEFVGKGGVFTKHVLFSIIDTRIDFGQENMGLPAHMEKEIRLPFDVLGLPKEMEVTAGIKAEKKGKPLYEVKVERDKDERKFWRHEAVIRDLMMDDEAEPGTTETYFLHIRAEAQPGEGRRDRLPHFPHLHGTLTGSGGRCHRLLPQGQGRRGAVDRQDGRRRGLGLEHCRFRRHGTEPHGGSHRRRDRIYEVDQPGNGSPGEILLPYG